jgi:hypothetical protein
MNSPILFATKISAIDENSLRLRTLTIYQDGSYEVEK